MDTELPRNVTITRRQHMLVITDLPPRRKVAPDTILHKIQCAVTELTGVADWHKYLHLEMKENSLCAIRIGITATEAEIMSRFINDTHEGRNKGVVYWKGALNMVCDL